MTFAARYCWLRLWTALLCLVASFAYLTREPDSLVTRSLPSLMAGMAMDMNGEMPGMDMHQTEHPAYDLPSAPDNSAHNHAAHCPFCFSAAFALEAQTFVLWIGAAQHVGFLSLPYRPPHLLMLRLAEARAPPWLNAET